MSVTNQHTHLLKHVSLSSKLRVSSLRDLSAFTAWCVVYQCLKLTWSFFWYICIPLTLKTFCHWKAFT